MPRRERVSFNDSKMDIAVKTPSFTVGIVGATGAAGQELLALLHERNFPLACLRLFASGRSAGKAVPFRGREIPIEEARPGVFADIDVAFFATSGSVSRSLAPDAVKAGCLVIDKSSHYRLDPDVPLVIPEINPQALRTHRGIIANPNCSTAVALMGIWPLHQRFGLKRYFTATYQSVSGSGLRGVRELEAQVQAHVKGLPMEPRGLPAPDRLQRDPPGRLVRTGRLHGGGDQDHAGEPQDHGPAAPAGLRHLRACARSFAPIRWRSTPSLSARSASRRPGRPLPRFRARTRRRTRPRGIPDSARFQRQVKCGVGRIRMDTASKRPRILGERGQPLEGRRAQRDPERRVMVREGLLRPGRPGRSLNPEAVPQLRTPSSVVRAPRLHRGGRGFESLGVHQFLLL